MHNQIKRPLVIACLLAAFFSMSYTCTAQGNDASSDCQIDKFDAEKIGHMLDAKNKEELDSIAFPDKKYFLLGDDVAWIVYGFKLRQFGFRAESDRVIAPRIPVDFKQRDCQLRFLDGGYSNVLT